MATLIETRWVEDGSAVVMMRLVGKDGTGTAITGEGKPFKQADISTITYGVYDITGAAAVVAAGTSITVSAVIFDTLQTDSFWTVDSTNGYNFLHTIAASSFPTGNSEYAVEYTFTLTGGTAFKIQLKGTAQAMYLS